jgi:hypothetical protein
MYRDKRTGATASRFGLDELLKDCRRRTIDVVVVLTRVGSTPQSRNPPNEGEDLVANFKHGFFYVRCQRDVVQHFV